LGFTSPVTLLLVVYEWIYVYMLYVLYVYVCVEDQLVGWGGKGRGGEGCCLMLLHHDDCLFIVVCLFVCKFIDWAWWWYNHKTQCQTSFQAFQR